jgi:DNA-binding MarR family transcriptional regulator
MTSSTKSGVRGVRTMVGNIHDLLSYRLARVAGLNDRSGHAHLTEEFSITLSEWRVLGNIRTLAPVTLSDVSRAMLIDKGQLSRTVSALVARGWLQSQASKLDRRTAHVSLTPSGLREHDRILAFAVERNQSVLDVLEPDEQRALLRTLAKLERFVEVEHGALAGGSARLAETTARQIALPAHRRERV